MNKLNKNILRIIAHILVIFLTFFVEKALYQDYSFSVDRIIILQLVNQLILTTLIYDKNKVWEQIYKKRYQIALIIFAFLVINGYHGSSIGLYDQAVEPNTTIKGSQPFFGSLRSIRSDEYMVDSMITFSNVLTNNLKSTTNKIMGSKVTLNFYPHYPTNDIGSITRINYIGYMLLPVEQAFSFAWYLPFFVSFMALFELFIIITKNKKLLSLLGTILICCSPCLLWWNSYMFLMFGLLSFHFLRLFLISESKKKKILYTLLLSLSGINYIMILYPAWQIPYGYLFLVLFIWVLYEYRRNIKWNYLIYLVLCLLIVGMVCGSLMYISYSQLEAMMSTVYPGARYITGGSEWGLNFMYMPSIFYSFFDVGNPCEFSQTISLYPLPTLFGIFIFIKNFIYKKHDFLLNGLIIILIVFTLFNCFEIPILPRVTLLYMVPCERLTAVIGIINVFLLIIILAKYSRSETTCKDTLLAAFISILTTLLIVCICYIYLKSKGIVNYFNLRQILVAILVFFSLSLFFCLNDKKYNNYFAILFIIVNLISTVGIFPMSKGIDIVTEKPVAKEVRKLVANDEQALWIVTNTDIRLCNYLLANGARVYNSVNFYKNEELWKIIDPKNEFDNIYNRYAHIMFGIKNGDTKYELIQSDLFIAHLDSTKICELGVKYIYSGVDLAKEKYDNLQIETIYKNDGTYLYETICE